MMATDPITAEVIKHALASLADEMALVIMRSGYSPVVRDSMDYSTAICDQKGRVIAQGLTLAIQLGTFPHVMPKIVQAAQAPGAADGDIYVFNDPFDGGQHLPDIYIIKPIHVAGALIGFAATMAHHSDVGGIAPGSVAMHATEVYQEGLRIPLVRLFRAGEENQEMFSILEKNSRNPLHLLGDIRAQVAACKACERGLRDIIAKWGAAHFATFVEEFHDLAELRMVEAIRALGNGEAEFTDYIDGIGDDGPPLPIKVAVKIQDGQVDVDFTGTAAQVEAGINAPVSMAYAISYCAIRSIVSGDIPNCEGYTRPIRVHAPEGTVVNPVLPAACGARGVIGYRSFDAIMGALAKIWPEKVIAPGEGGPILISIGGRHGGQPFVMTEVMVGNWGARYGKDGIDGVSNPAANLSNQPIEIVEAEYPIAIDRYEMVSDSGGAGQWRGGLAFRKDFRILAERANLTVRNDRRRFRPYGIQGGEPGAGSDGCIIRNGERMQLPTMPMRSVELRRGDVFSTTSAGGGGYGDPRRRDPDLIEADHLDGKTTRPDPSPADEGGTRR
jgi:N-methylhydantoinase B